MTFSGRRCAPAGGAEQIGGARADLERRLLEIFLTRVREQPLSDEAEREERLRSVQNRIVDVLDAEQRIAEQASEDDYDAEQLFFARVRSLLSATAER